MTDTTKKAISWADLPQEIADLILREVVKEEKLRVLNAVILSFVCHQWKGKDFIAKATIIPEPLPYQYEEDEELPNKTTDLTAAAAQHGWFSLLKWLREMKCPWDPTTCNGAAIGGHLEILKWAREKGCPWYEGVCFYAAQAGKFEVLKWLREGGCPWDLHTCSGAAAGGHLDILKWAREQGCP